MKLAIKTIRRRLHACLHYLRRYLRDLAEAQSSLQF
jgi:hypothetical protein